MTDNNNDDVVFQRTANDDTKETEAVQDVEGETKKLKYPRSIAFIISNEFCERFNYYGMRTVLVLYLTRKLMYEEDTATVIYHLFTTFVYFLCVVGAIIADSWLGKFKTILYLSLVYVVGSTIMAVGAIPTLDLPGRVFAILGLALIALGSGGIKPCVAAFGGDQFKMPEQAKQIASFFSLFYFSINAGSLISTTVTPILREDVDCFGEGDCFPLAFGVPGILMAISVVIFVGGKFLYIIKKPAGNMVVSVTKCIANAISTRSKEKKISPREHWLDYAEPVHGKQLVEDVKALLKVLVLYTPLPIFWALFDQQGSRWTFQATRMDGDLGGWSIKPDQMQVVNPLLILVFIPLFDTLIYPLIAKCGIRRPLQKLCIGGILAGVAFVISAIIELELEKTYPVVPGSDQAQLKIFNGMPCDLTFTSTVNGIDNLPNINVEQMGMFEENNIYATQDTAYNYIADGCAGASFPIVFTLQSRTSTSYFVQGENQVLEYEDSNEKSSNGNPLVRILSSVTGVRTITFQHEKESNTVTNSTSFSGQIPISSNTYTLFVDEAEVMPSLELKQGGVYTIIIREIAGAFAAESIIISQPNSVHMLWLIPQFVIMTMGEVMFSVTGLEFSYSQAPVSMKAVLQACWLLTVAFGNLIVVIVAGSKGFDSQASEFFLFAGLMFVDMVLFAWLAYRYVPNVVKLEGEEEEMLEGEEKPTPVGAIGAAKRESNKEKLGIDNSAFIKED